MLQSAGRLRTPFGERAFAILLFQDLSIIPLITIVAALSRNPADRRPAGLADGADDARGDRRADRSPGACWCGPLFRLIATLGEREMFVVAALFIVIAAAALMEALGLSTALGAFVAGVMLADTPFRHEIEADVEPFRSILLGLFFLSVGMLLDLPVIAADPLFVIGMARGADRGEDDGHRRPRPGLRMRWREALALGLLLSQGGEFGFVLFARAQQGLLITPGRGEPVRGDRHLSMATTPFLMMATERIRKEPRHAEEPGARGRAPTAPTR